MEKIEKNPDLMIPISKDNRLKELITEYVGEKLSPENGEVTVEMILDVFTTDFPEFLIPLAEENFIRGYELALNDIENTSE
tara:strand:- start:181 stop:423 length:243 start_codon:yes stop_codon:yes gene_type:complete